MSSFVMLLRSILWTYPVLTPSSAPVFDHKFLQTKTEVKEGLWNEDIMDIDCDANSKVRSIINICNAFLCSIVQLRNGYNIILQTLCLSLSYINQTTTGIQHHLCSTYRALGDLVAVWLSLVSGRVLAAQARYLLYSRQLLSFCLCSISPHSISISLYVSNVRLF